jgi:hypothetical protein
MGTYIIYMAIDAGASLFDTGAPPYGGVTFDWFNCLTAVRQLPHKSGEAAALTISIFGASPSQRAMITIFTIIAVAVAIIAVAFAIVITIAAIFGTICAFCANWNYRIVLDSKGYHDVHAHTIETAETIAQQKCLLSIESSMYKGEREESLWPQMVVLCGSSGP